MKKDQQEDVQKTGVEGIIRLGSRWILGAINNSRCLKTYSFVILSLKPKKQNYQAWKSPKGKAYQGIGEGELNSTGYQILSIDGVVSNHLSGELRRL